MKIFFELLIIKGEVNKNGKEEVERALPFLLIAFIPFTWNFFMGDQCYYHYWFTFKEF
ncbi:hypothetical protein [Eisenbergiella massiliensis]|jgi:hypothetical protein|uniref:hypothetical protein n=1 Tax=Eisenbergiella massiliensis TaxID=1720294 RepID=UPI0015E1B6BC|nr:hypothetical protein [Eisenbergiella massiliensis]